MSSILTNNSAMVALQTLKSVNADLAKTQDAISTGKAVATAKDNAAVFAISKVMESDVSGFRAISESLSLGEATVAVARNAAETVTDLLTQMKERIVAAQGDNVDRTKLQADVTALRGQIESVVDGAQFNGLNLVNGSATGTNVNANEGVNILASLNRDTSGQVAASSIGVDAQNLSTAAGLALTETAAAVGNDPGTAGVIDADDGTPIDNNSITLDTFVFQEGGAALAANDPLADASDADGLIAGDRLSLTVGTVQGSITVNEGDTAEDLVARLSASLTANGLDGQAFTLDISTAGELQITNNTNVEAAFSFDASRGSGGLSALGGLDVSSSAGAANALGAIENLIDTSITAAASFGSVQSRIETQSNFVSNLTDSLRSGIGALVDADLQEASARLQALQVQQQLATQSLSIANQAPQAILALFN